MLLYVKISSLAADQIVYRLRGELIVYYGAQKLFGAKFYESELTEKALCLNVDFLCVFLYIPELKIIARKFIDGRFTFVIGSNNFISVGVQSKVSVRRLKHVFIIVFFFCFFVCLFHSLIIFFNIQLTFLYHCVHNAVFLLLWSNAVHLFYPQQPIVAHSF